MQEVEILNHTRPLSSPIRAGYCVSFFCHLRGLMFRNNLPPNWGLLLVGKRDSRADSAIHMFFMKMDLAIVWMDSQKKVVDARHAYRWRSVIVPKAPAMYILELPAERLRDFRISDQIRIT